MIYKDFGNPIGSNKKNKNKLKVIVPLRDPFSHRISRFFENFHRVLSRYAKNKKSYEDLSIEDLKIIFLQWCAQPENNRLAPEYWIKSLCENFDISKKEIFDNFDPNKGYLVIKTDRLEVLIYRYDIDRNIVEEQISNLINANFCFPKKNLNVGKEKVWHKQYNIFLKEIGINSSLAKSMGNSKFFKTFYTIEAQNSIKSKYYFKTW